MTRRAALLFLALPFCASAERTLDDPSLDSLPETIIARATSPITIDGKANDAAWSAAEPVEFVLPWTDLETEAAQSTTARMLWDDKALYILYECVDPYLDAEVTEHDGPVWEEDAVEIFVTPNPDDVTAYFGYEMNATGVFLDYLAFNGGEKRTENIHFEWQSEGVQIATTYDGTLNDHDDKDKGWVLEVAIPFDNFRHLGGRIPPQPGDHWRLNLNRTKGDHGQFGIWSDTGTENASFHHSAYFGYAWFTKKPKVKQ